MVFQISEILKNAVCEKDEQTVVENFQWLLSSNLKAKCDLKNTCNIIQYIYIDA